MACERCRKERERIRALLMRRKKGASAGRLDRNKRPTSPELGGKKVANYLGQ